jgi:putative FmdB family regulatory protein
MPIYEYRCDACSKRSSSLLASYATPDPPCPHCGKPALRRLVSSFATVRSTEGGDFGGEGGMDGLDGGEEGGDFGGEGFDGGDFGGGDFGGDDY